MTSDLPANRMWDNSPLYLFLLQILPQHRTARGALDIRKLKVDIGRSHERIYQWLRSSQLAPKNAKALHALANTPENVAALVELGRTPPEIQDFLKFVITDADD